MMPEQSEKDDDRKRYAQQPQQRASTKAHLQPPIESWANNEGGSVFVPLRRLWGRAPLMICPRRQGDRRLQSAAMLDKTPGSHWRNTSRLANRNVSIVTSASAGEAPFIARNA
jgi:hypothetical protein